MQEEYYQDIIKQTLTKKLSKEKVAKLKIKLCKKHKVTKIPTDIQVLLHAEKKDIPKLKKYLLTKPTRTISGVAVVAVMTKPIKCPHGKCITCPGGPGSVFGDVPQSYTGKEPATRRAIRNLYDPYLQVMNRLEQYIVTGHMPDKIELIIMGGTFPNFKEKYQEEFVTYSLKAMNDFSKLFFKNNKLDITKFKKFFELPGDVKDKKRELSIKKKLLKLKGKSNLSKEQKKNEKSSVRCIGLTIETRPDYGKLKHGNQMLKLGCTRVELGVQSIYEEVLKKIKRGHSIEDSVYSIRTLKDLGFKINIHYMPGLFVSRKKDLEGLLHLFRSELYRPDMLKLYPCMVVKGTKLHKIWKKGKFKPLTTKQAASLIADFKRFVPQYCRIMRVQRDIPTFMTEAGVDKTNLRQYVKQIMKKNKWKCKCIRCREIGRMKDPTKIKAILMKGMHYKASKGIEFFMAAEAKNHILGFCRMRFPSKPSRKEITEDSALIRELHVYGPATQIGKKGKVQHRGIGKILLERAEKIAKNYYKTKLVVISGIGAREYYRKLGFKKQGVYMVKNLN